MRDGRRVVQPRWARVTSRQQLDAWQPAGMGLVRRRGEEITAVPAVQGLGETVRGAWRKLKLRPFAVSRGTVKKSATKLQGGVRPVVWTAMAAGKMIKR